MSEFVVTFGQKYARELHPSFPQAHPDGYLSVTAPNDLLARAAVQAVLGTAWSGMYSGEARDDVIAHWAPRGEVGRVTITEDGRVWLQANPMDHHWHLHREHDGTLRLVTRP